MLGVARRNPEFRKLWGSQLVSQAGDWLNRVAILTLIGQLGGAAEQVGVGALFGVELAIRLLPTAVLSPIAGPLADRVPRKALMISMDLARAVVVLGYLTIDSREALPRLYVLMLVHMGLSIFANAARSAAAPSTLPKEELHEAFVLLAATWSTMLALGAFAGGLLVPVIGLAGVFLVDAATFVVSAALVGGLKLPPVPRHAAALKWMDVVSGRELRVAWSHARERGVAAAVGAKACWGGAGGFLVLLSIAGTQRFGDPAAGAGLDPAAAGAAGFATGLLYCARGLGTGLGPILARRRYGSSDVSLRRQIAGGFLFAGLIYALFGPATQLWAAFAVVLIAHMGGSTIWVASSTWWQRHVEDAFRGRVFAVEFLGMTLSFTAGGFLTGAVYDATGSIALATYATCAMVLGGGALWRVLARG
jgi:predicted MFS family arabinose efflux permease